MDKIFRFYSLGPVSAHNNASNISSTQIASIASGDSDITPVVGDIIYLNDVPYIIKRRTLSANSYYLCDIIEYEVEEYPPMSEDFNEAAKN